MDDLIASLTTSHVSQDHHDLENFKASLARALPTPPVHRNSISMQQIQAPSFSTSFQDFYLREGTPAPPYEAHSHHMHFDEDMDLEAAFAGDAFAPLHNKAKEDAWAGFRPIADAKPAFAFNFGGDKQPAVATFQFQIQQPAPQPTAPVHQYAQYSQYETDEDAAEAMITDE